MELPPSAPLRVDLFGGRVAFFGGSFDPPHQGHLAIARAARDALRLDSVVFAPVGAQPLKPLGSSAGFDDRVAMTRLAIAKDAGFSVSLVDAPRIPAAPNYTIDSLIQLRGLLPPASDLYCLIGADSFLSMSRWHRAAEIPFVAPLIVAARPGQSLDDLAAALPAGLRLDPGHLDSDRPDFGPGIPAGALERRFLRDDKGRTSPLYLLPSLHFDISASQIRAEIHAGPATAAESSQVLPAAVLDYIRAHGLYR